MNGEDSIFWLTPTELDTNQYQGPYNYKIFNANGSFIHQLPSKNFLYQLENTYSINNINTVDNNRIYKVGLYYTYFNADSLIGFSSNASSIYLNTLPNDNQIELFWTESTPWDNENIIYRSDSIDGNFLLLDSSISPYYLDSGLVNQKNIVTILNLLENIKIVPFLVLLLIFLKKLVIIHLTLLRPALQI